MFQYKLLKQKSVITFAAFLFCTFIVGIASALQSPTLSRFLTDEVKVSPIMVGTFYSVNAIASVIGSFLLAKYSDRKSERKKIVIFCCLMGITNSLIFAFTRYYFVLITVGVFFAALASSAMPQIFALAREYAVKTGRNVVAFNSLIRAQLSLAWVIGPPLSFFLAVNYGFVTMYLSGASMLLVAMILVFLFLPKVEKNPAAQHKTLVMEQSLLKNSNVIFLFLATVFMWTANMLYLIDMPLYVDKVLQLPTSLPGQLMGLAAGIEIPIMIIAGFLVPKVGKRNLMLIAVGCGVVFYIGLNLFDHYIMFFVLQLFNALFIGIVANIGIIYFQDLLPTRMGVASTLFNNGVTCSVILAGLLQGIIVDFFGHSAVYKVALLMILISFVFCYKVESTDN